MREIRVRVVRYPDRESLMLRYVDPLTKRAVSKTAGTTKRRDALRAAAQWEAELRAHRGSLDRLPWATFRERYDAEHAPALAPKTRLKVDTVLDAVERIIRPRLLAEMTSERLSRFAHELRNEMAGTGDDRHAVRSPVTVDGYLRHLRAVLNWAHHAGMLASAPKVSRLSRATAQGGAKGRALTGEEFERLLAVVPKALAGQRRKAPDETELAAWNFYLRGLWTSGFRLRESLALSWDDDRAPRLDLTGRRPVVRFPAGSQKSGKAETWPVPPDLAELLAAVPESRRRGRVFRLTIGGRPASAEAVQDAIGRMGRLAGIVVSRKADGAVKHASAHDLRRSFCTRWARLVMPQVLCRLARHRSISTTLTFYVARDAETVGDAIWDAFGANSAQKGNKIGNTSPVSAFSSALADTE